MKRPRLCGCSHPESWHELVTVNDHTQKHLGRCSHGCGCPGFHCRGGRPFVPSLLAPSVAPAAPTREEAIALFERAMVDVTAAVIALCRASWPGASWRAAPPATASFAPPAPKRDKDKVTLSVDGTPVVLDACARRCLEVLVQRAPRTTTRDELAIMGKYSVRSGGFAGSLALLRKVGYMAGAARALRATEAGIAAAGDVQSLLQSGHELRAHWMQRLRDYKNGKCAAAVLGAAISSYPQEIGRTELAALAGEGYAPTSGGFAGAIALLRRLGLLERRGYRPTQEIMGEERQTA